MITMTCGNCGVEYGLTEVFHACRKRDARDFFCPNGHKQSYSESDSDRLRKQLEAKEREVARERSFRNDAERERDTARKRQAKAEKRLTRIEERIAKGICPCCDRRFENLAQHVAEMHPEFAEHNPTIMSRFRGLLAEIGTHPDKGDGKA